MASAVLSYIFDGSRWLLHYTVPDAQRTDSKMSTKMSLDGSTRPNLHSPHTRRFAHLCLWCVSFWAAGTVVGPATANADQSARRPAPKPASKSKPKARPGPKEQKRLRRLLPFPLAGIKLPSTHSPLMQSSVWQKVRTPPPSKRTGQRKRLPLRRIKMAGQYKLQTQTDWRASPQPRGRRGRKEIKVQAIGGDRPQRILRLVIYRHWLGRHGWVRQWQGHVYVMARGKRRFQCPRTRFCHRLKQDVRQLLRTQSQRLAPGKPNFAWRLRRALERTKGYEVEVQMR